MKCWKCGQENVQNVSQCVYCGAGMNRPEPETEIGAALRQLYDHYGAEKMLTNPLLMVNGLGDLVQDSGKFRSQLKMALDAGIGKVYLEQIRTAGKPDYNFDSRVLAILIEDAELSEPAANKIMDAMDEMIGWQAPAQLPPQPAPKAPVQPPVQVNRPSEPEYTLPDLDSEKKTRWPLILIALLVVAVAAFLIANQSQGWVPVPWATSTPSPSPTPTPVPETPTPTPTPSPEPTPAMQPHFNENGSLMYTEYVNEAGEIIKTVYEPEVKYYNEDGSLNYTEYYNEAGQKTKVVEVDENGKAKKIRFLEYNDFGVRIYRRIEYYSDEILRSYSITDYDANGKKVLYKEFDANGIMIYEAEYDTNENVALVRDFDANGTMIYEAEYDTNGKKIIDRDFDVNGKMIYKREYGPDEKLRRLEYYLSGIIKSASEYNSAEQEIRSELYTDGEMVEYSLYEYDANGNKTKRRKYDRDGNLKEEKEFGN